MVQPLGRPLARRADTLEDLREEFLARCEARSLSGRTLEWYADRTRRFADWCSDRRISAPSDLRWSDLEEFVLDRRRKGFAPNTVHGYAQVLKTLCRLGHRIVLLVSPRPEPTRSTHPGRRRRGGRSGRRDGRHARRDRRRLPRERPPVREEHRRLHRHPAGGSRDAQTGAAQLTQHGVVSPRGLLLLGMLWRAWFAYAWLTNTLDRQEGLEAGGQSDRPPPGRALASRPLQEDGVPDRRRHG